MTTEEVKLVVTVAVGAVFLLIGLKLLLGAL